MILKALCDFFERHKDLFGPLGMEYKSIDFVICISRDGQFLRFEDMRKPDKKESSKFMVERMNMRTAKEEANILYDKSAYILGFELEKQKKVLKSTPKALECFKQFTSHLYEVFPQDMRVKALNTFYHEKWDCNKQLMEEHNLWADIQSEIKKRDVWFSFKYENENRLLSEDGELVLAYKQQFGRKLQRGRCLVTGKLTDIVDLVYPTPIYGSKSTAKLVSCNKDKGFSSYGKEQGENAPIGECAEFAITSSLKYLHSESRHKFRIGSKTFVFWVSSTNDVSDEFEDMFAALWGAPVDNENAERMRSVFEAIYSGKRPIDSEDTFYVLALKPNSARIALSYWAEIPLKEFSGNILKHFDDVAIIGDQRTNKNTASVFTMLRSVTRESNSSEVKSNLIDAVVKSIFEGTAYPYPLLYAALQRVRTEQRVSSAIASILKGFLNRLNNTDKVDYMLNKELDNPAYQLGRFFAVVARMQYLASERDTLTKQYLVVASTTPVSIFPRLMQLSNYYSSKLSDSRRRFYDKLQREIMGRIDASAGIPAVMSPTEKANFYLGYYHQKEDLFQPKEKESSEHSAE